jgi:hypothetical protein
MRLESGLQRRFEPCLQRPLENSRKLRKHLAAERPQREALATDDPLLRSTCEDSLDGLLGIIQRKTTPFYVRLIHAAVHFYLSIETEDGAQNLREAAQVIDSVASTVNREKFRIPQAWQA